MVKCKRHENQSPTLGFGKGRTAVAIKKGIHHNHRDSLPFVSIVAPVVFIPNRYSEILRTAVWKSAGRAWIGADITEIINL